MEQLLEHNYDRESYSFANINLLGKCNVNCYFCLGKDLEKDFSKTNSLNTSFLEWPNFEKFVKLCEDNKIHKIYITGQNTDSLCYKYLGELIDYLHQKKFGVGIRTNGVLALKRMSIVNTCDLSVGYSIHSLNDETNTKIMGVKCPDWNSIIPSTVPCRVSIVLNRYNYNELEDIIKYVSQFNNVKYIQVRRVSTEFRVNELLTDIELYEKKYVEIKNKYPFIKTLWKNADVFEIYGKEVCFWRTIKTSVNSINYFTDGVLSDEYFVILGYLKNKMI